MGYQPKHGKLTTPPPGWCPNPGGSSGVRPPPGERTTVSTPGGLLVLEGAQLTPEHVAELRRGFDELRRDPGRLLVLDSPPGARVQWHPLEQPAPRQRCRWAPLLHLLAAVVTIAAGAVALARFAGVLP